MNVSVDFSGLITASQCLMLQKIVDNSRTVLHLIALPFNTMNIFVFTHTGMRTPTSQYHVAMSISQIVYTLCSLISSVGRMADLWTDSCYFCTLYSTIVGHCLLVSTNRVMYGLICLMSVDRFLAIAFPLKGKALGFARTPVISIISLYLLVFLTHMYFAVRTEVFPIYISDAMNNTVLPVNCGSSSNEVKISGYGYSLASIAEQDQSTASLHETYGENPAGTSNNASLLLGFTIWPGSPTNEMAYPRQSSVSALPSPCPASSTLVVTTRVIWGSRFSSYYLANSNLIATWVVAAGVVWVYVAVLMGLLMNILLVFILLRHSRQRATMTTSDGNDKRDRQVRQTTKTVLVSSLIFVCLSLLLVSNSIASSVFPTYSNYSKLRYTYLSVHNLGQLCFSISLCTDLVTFVLLSSSYRATLVSRAGAMFALCRKTNAKDAKGHKTVTESSGVDTETGVFSMSVQETWISSGALTK